MQLSLLPSAWYSVYTKDTGYAFGWWVPSGRYLIVMGQYIKEEDFKKHGVRIGLQIKPREF